MDVTPSTQQIQLQNQPNSVGTTPLTSPGAGLHTHTWLLGEVWGFCFPFVLRNKCTNHKQEHLESFIMRKDSIIRIPFVKIKITLQEHNATSAMTETHAETNRRFWVNNIMPLQAQKGVT